ncbi:MAG: TetR/AcrR family transcriptional regulator [Spirochaetia bacterium]|jgi:AcrR family transcriptional regulator|nr:TetR/AcrR family transcriptional regulator [Spirochaetia bacterium]
MENINFKQTVSELRRNSILEGAEKIFCEKGYYKASTKLVAKTAGVGEGTIYNYFKNKRQLLLSLLEKIVMEPIKKIMMENPPDNPEQFLKLVIENRSNFVKKYGSLLASLLTEISKDPKLMDDFYQKIIRPFSDLLENYLQKQESTGRFRAINPLIISNGIIGAIWLNSAFKESSLDNRYQNISQEELTEELIDWIIGGLITKIPEV